MSKKAVCLQDLGICCALGGSQIDVLTGVLQGEQSNMVDCSDMLIDGKKTVVGRVQTELPELTEFPSHFHSRNNQIALHCLRQIADSLSDLKANISPDRIAVVIGTSTSGIAEGELALQKEFENERLPASYDYRTQEMGAVAEFIRYAAGVFGPAYVISTACSSSAQALINARELIHSGLADAVICGGVDSLCRLTLNGFDALESLDSDQCQPFSANRKGINIGEGGALFLMTSQPSGLQLLGAGNASDAYHMSAPHPEGRGAREAIQRALAEAELSVHNLGYINLHGTATPLNDAMESHVLHHLGADTVPASSTKALTGHTLGAAGAIEAGICWLLLSPLNTDNKVAPHVFDGEIDDFLQPILLASKEMSLRHPVCLSNSFAFGGSNVCLVIGRSCNE